MEYDVFNGDADGLCALQQLRLQRPRDSELITGTKREISLLERLQVDSGDQVTVLDVSLDKNRAALLDLLEKGAQVLYVDHHYAGNIPEHPGLQAHINTTPTVCTAILVNGLCQNRYLPWAITGAFGDNLANSAKRLAQQTDLNDRQVAQLQELGELLNYNGYGASLEDLHFAPHKLAQIMLPYGHPLDFIEQEPAFTRLRDGYAQDNQHAEDLRPELEEEHIALYILPNTPWARRISGDFANRLARKAPQRAHALLTPKQDEAFVVSVRAPYSTKTGADSLCRQFDTGGGREAAAGINHLPRMELDQFIDRFRDAFAH